MSWFDATGLANIAKSALKEAQKTIDKALDIKDDVDDIDNVQLKPEKNKADGDFFASWGLNEDPKSETETLKTTTMKEANETPIKSSNLPTSLWGSFSGSFFEVGNSKASTELQNSVSAQSEKLALILSDENQKIAPLATPESASTPIEPTVGLVLKSLNETSSKQGNNLKLDNADIKSKPPIADTFNTKSNLEIRSELDLKAEDPNTKVVIADHKTDAEEGSAGLLDEKVITRPKARRNSSNRSSYISNRLSVISTESEGKKSSDSVEVLGSLSSTTSPDTDLPSISASSSMGLPGSSSYTDSVEVIDSLASPSSIEVIGDISNSGRTTQSSEINSPKEENVNQYSKELIILSSPINSLTSPESVEVIPDLNELDEELSVADSYTSASESTGATILEPPYSYACRMTESFTDLSQASSKFRSGESTPDMVSKLPMMNRSSCDILSESIHEDSTVDNLSTSITKNSNDFDQLNQKKAAASEANENFKEIQSRLSRSMHGSPTRRSLSKSEEKINWFKSEDPKTLRLDLSKSEIIRTYSTKRDFEDGGLPESDFLSLDEVCGSISSQSDTKTVIANDSSCEEATFESSTEDTSNLDLSDESNAQNLNRHEEKIEHYRNPNSSFYVKNLLAEAMGDDALTRETSPTLSEKSRSDLIKIGSEQTSGHTSGDELETTTSSDIEIISRYSPNGDSSSTTSRHSPAKLLHHNSKGKLSLVAVDILGKATHMKTKGHQREPSDGSSFCSEENSSEAEKLAKRVMELTEILEARESKLIDLSRTNLELQEKNQELKRQMEQAKIEVAARLSAGQSEALFAEKDELIRELREEGEKLSKTQLKQSNLIRSLRSQEKTQQSTIAANKKQIESLSQELQQVKMKLSSKEEIERTQIDNINQLTNKINRQDKEIANLLDQMEKAVVKAEELKLRLDNSETELENYRKQLAATELELRDAKSIAESKTKQMERLKKISDNAQEVQDGLYNQLQDLRQQLKNSEETHSRRETSSREEINNLMRRLQEAEARNEELAQSVSTATRPLLRQMEALQATTSHERDTWEKQEKNLLQLLGEAESHLSSVLHNEKTVKQESLELRTKVNHLESQLSASLQEVTVLKNKVENLEKNLKEAESALESEKSNSQKQQDLLKSQASELKKEITALEHQLSIERAATESERKKTISLQDQLKDRDVQIANRDLSSPRSSPTLSFGRVSLSESLSSNLWPQFGEETFETGSLPGRCSNIYDSLRIGNTTSLIEGLQAQLKMRDGEVAQLQWELQRRDLERSALTSELSALTTKLEEQEAVINQAEVTSKKLKELQMNYDALLEMYGEKVEETDELKLDLQDVKDMYKSQIDQLLGRDKQPDVLP